MIDTADPVAPSWAAYMQGLAAARDAYEAACTAAQAAYLTKLDALRVEYENARAKERV